MHSIRCKQISFCDQEFCTNLAVYLKITVIVTVKKHMSEKITLKPFCILELGRFEASRY